MPVKCVNWTTWNTVNKTENGAKYMDRTDKRLNYIQFWHLYENDTRNGKITYKTPSNRINVEMYKPDEFDVE